MVNLTGDNSNSNSNNNTNNFDIYEKLRAVNLLVNSAERLFIMKIIPYIYNMPDCSNSECLVDNKQPLP